MAFTQTVPELLEIFHTTNSVEEKCAALVHFRSNFAKAKSPEGITEADFSALYKILVSADDAKIQQEACCTLNIILLDQKYTKPSFFESVQQIDTKISKLRIFSILEKMEDNAVAVVANDPQIINFYINCFQSIDVKTMPWLSPTFCTDNLQKLVACEQKPLTEDEKLEEKIVLQSLNFLSRIFRNVKLLSSKQVQLCDSLVMDKVMNLVYMGLKSQREPALKLFDDAVKADIGIRVRHMSPNSWIAYKKILQDTYSARMCLLVASFYPDWANLWNSSIELLGRDLHRGAGLINNLLSVEEKAFKSSDTNIRRQAFYSWKLLVDNFALDPLELASARRIKLLCVPLIAKNSKTEVIAFAKFEVWWHLIVKVYNDLPKFVTSVLGPFLNFCFGPLGDTPLLSSTLEIVASPGKRFPKTKLASLDALLQLLAAKEANFGVFVPVLEERLPYAVTTTTFEESYKTFTHSVFEALLILGQFEEKEVPNRKRIGGLLWRSLLSKIEETADARKAVIFKDVILVVTEITHHISNNPLIKNLLYDVILISLAERAETFVFCDDTLANLIKVLLTEMNLNEHKKEYCEAIKRLLLQTVKTNNVSNVSLGKLQLLNSVLEKIRNERPGSSNTNMLVEMWCMLAEISTKYMEKGQQINEGDAAQHKFTTIEAILAYPFHYLFLDDPAQVQRVITFWWSMYKQFDSQADFEPTIKPNEILIQTSNMLRDALKKEKRRFPLFAGCLNVLISNINYQSLLGEEDVPSIVHLINDLVASVFKESQFNSFEVVLRALSALLITVFGLNMKKSLQYLEVVRPSIEFLLSQKTSEFIEKEIADTWDTVVTIFKGVNKHLTYDLLSSFQKCIVLALCHTSPKIISQAQVILGLGSNLEQKASKLLTELGSFSKKSVVVESKGDSKPKADAKSKQVKVSGSFLNRKSTASPIPHSFVSPATNKPKKQTPVPPDPDSQDYVVIKSDIKFDVNRLTEHQKESLKKRRDDIPALYNDLSQSGSQDSQELQKWFEVKQVNKTDSSKRLSTKCDSNKENKVSVPESKPTSKPEDSSKELPQVKEGVSENEVPESETDQDSFGESSIAKKLDFESREEFPDNKEADNRNGEENEDSKTAPEPVNRAKKRMRSLGNKNTPESGKKRSKRKIDDDEADHQKRKKMNPSESSDNESIQSSENEEVLNKRVKSEISRLQIDMVRSVFEPLPNRRRSKLTDCTCKDPLCKKTHSPEPKVRLRSEGKLPEPGRKPGRPPGDSVKKRARKNSKQDADEEKKTNRKSLPKLEIFKGSETSEEKPSEVKKDDSQLNGEVESSVTESFQDSEEIVESSQDVTSKSKIANRLSDKKLLVKIDKMNSKLKTEVQNSEPEKMEKVEKVDNVENLESVEETKEIVIEDEADYMETLENQALSEVAEIKKHEASPSVKSNSVHLSSPKGIVKRTSKIKAYPLQGRAAQMLGLVTKQGLLEKDAKVEDDTKKLVVVQVVRKAESDNATNAKKEKSKETEKMGNPSGSRQEKIFNNMKSADYCASPPSKLFGSLKNDGEKISPKVAKTSDSLSSEKSTSNEKEIGELSPTRDYQLPILEWSSANPPSLTASPSAGILKRHNQSLPDLSGDPESVTPNKRKRVSFADPPVSQKMGYEVATGESPHSMNKPTRIHSMRKDTPLRPRQNRMRMFQMDVEKIDKSEMPFEGSNGIEVETEKADELVEIPDDLAFTEDTLMKMHGEVACPESSTPVRVSVDNSKEITIGDGSAQKLETEESKRQSAKLVEEIFGTQEDMFAAGDTSDDSLKILNQSAEKKDKGNISDHLVSLESIKFNSTNDSLSDTASLPKDASKSESLEDTVDVQNVSSFDSTDEAFCGKPVRCSTREAEQDTLPVTDSVFGSISQETQNSTPNVANLPKPETLDSTQPIFPPLVKCTEPVTAIIENLANPLWVNHLTSCLASREIRTIGHLASLSEREINRIPVKGNPKVDFVKSVLARFETGKTGVAATNSEMAHLEKTPLEGTTAPAQNSSVYPGNETSVEEPTLSSTLGLGNLALTNEPQDGTSVSAIESKKVKPQTSSRSVSVQMELADLLDEIDVNQVLESAVRRCTPESIIAQYKAKMRHMPEHELEAETLRMLGLELKPNHNEVTLKSACKACGIDKVLLKLPDIFRGEKQFFAKVLSTYQKKIKVSDCVKALDEEELKEALCQKCKSSDLAEMLSKCLKMEEGQGIVESISDPPTLDRILKRVPADLLISHTVANDELIPSHIVLDIALQNNTDVAIAQSLNTQREDKKEGVFHKLWTTSSALTHVEKEASEAEMLEIIKAIGLRLRPEKLLEAFKDSMNTENDSSENVLLGLFKVISAKLQPKTLLDVFYECMRNKITSNDS